MKRKKETETSFSSSLFVDQVDSDEAALSPKRDGNYTPGAIHRHINGQV